MQDFSYLRTTIADQLVERVEDVTKDFTSLVELGCMNGEFVHALHTADLLNRFKTVDQICWTPAQLDFDPALPDTVSGTTVTTRAMSSWEELCPGVLQPSSADLIVSNLALHNVNDLPNTLQQVKRALKPDGAFLCAMFGGDTLHELAASFAIAEQEREGGVSAHVHPMLPTRDACGLLSNAGLELVTVDSLQITVEYDNAFSLMRQLWWMGESNALKNRRSYVSKDTLLSAASIYQGLYGTKEGLIPATFEVIFMIGWAPHESQAKPLPPGIKGQVSLTKLGTGGEI